MTVAAQKIVDLLNALLEARPETARAVIDSGLPVPDPETFDVPGVWLRPLPEGNYLTTTGIYSAIGELMGRRIMSNYDKGVLTHFSLQCQPGEASE
jgi:hypothetical protein